MPVIIRTKNYVPEVYVSESRDFQLFTRVFDVVQNSCKYDIDSMLRIIDSDNIPTEYIENLKSKVGFYTNNVYDEDSIKFVLSAFPHIVRYKGSKLGIVRCVNTFLKASRVRGTPSIEIVNKDSDGIRGIYKIRIGIGVNRIDTTLLEDMLRYVIPSGYEIEIYFFNKESIPNVEILADSSNYASIDDGNSSTTLVRDEKLTGAMQEQSDEQLHYIEKDSLYNTVGLAALDDEISEQTES